MNRTRHSRVWIAATILATLVVPAVASSAGPGDELQENNKEIEKIEQRLDAITPEANSRKAALDRVQAEIRAISITANELKAKVSKIRSEVSTISAHIKATQKKIDKVEGIASEQAVALYKGGSTEVLDVLFNSTSLTELDTRAQMLGIVANENTGELIEYGRLKAEIQDENERLLAKKRDLADSLREQNKVLAKLAEKKAEAQAAYDKIAVKVSDLKHREGDLEAANDAIRARILASQSQDAAQDLGQSSQGFMWPICCSVTSPYGPRWGRMHTGIDIDGYTGQPVGASKAGTVIQASADGSGYGNMVIIDHGGGYATLYAHLSSFAVSSGQSVSAGQTVGAVGCTGSCTGDHLHFELRINGNPVDPVPYLP